MSWLNFNEGLNSLKGQLTNLAQSVLNEDEDVTGILCYLLPYCKLLIGCF